MAFVIIYLNYKTKGINMAKYETQLTGNLDNLLVFLEKEMEMKSFSSSLEDTSDFSVNGTRCVVQVYERYSFLGSNRVSLNITFLEVDEIIFIAAITSGGSQAVWFKVNTFGEKSFLNVFVDILEQFRKQ